MKKTIILFCLLCTLLACDNSLEINAPYRQIAVVYGFMDYNSPYQYIRVQKVFQNSVNQTAAVSAEKIDSLYFKDIKVQIINLSNNDTLTCTRIDSVPKNSGFFASDKHYLYRTPFYEFYKKGAVPVKLLITDTITKKEFTSTINLLEPHVVTQRPNEKEIDLNSYVRNFQFEYTINSNAKLGDAIIRFKYAEAPANNPGQEEVKFLDFFLQANGDISNLTGRNKINYSSRALFESWKTFFDAPAQNTNVVRRYLGLEHVSYASGNELSELLERNKLNTSVVQKNTDYSNIKDGLGIFVARTLFVQTNVGLQPSSLTLIKTLPKFQ
jgi:hypothetical protein